MSKPSKQISTASLLSRRNFLRTGILGLSSTLAGCVGDIASYSEVGRLPSDVPDMSLVFSDSFEGRQIDDTKWQKTFPWGNGLTTTFNGYASPKNAYICEGNLTLKAERKPQQGSDYTTGVLTSHAAFSTGFFEASIKVPPARPGIFPAFWMKPVDSWPPEIDIMEFFGSDPRNWMSYHYTDPTGTVQRIAGTYSGGDFSAGFHRYGVHWMPNEIIWYVDGKERYRYSSDFIGEAPMNMIFQFGIDPPFLRSPLNRDLPSYYQVERVCVWQ